MKARNFISVSLAVLLNMMLFPGRPCLAADIQKQEMKAIGVEVFVYTYPLVLMDLTRHQMTNIEAGKMAGRGPMMTFTHVRTYPEADHKEVVRPNFDTLYSLAWLDLTKEPAIISVPENKDRFYLLPILDMWTDVFAVIGTLTTGTESGNYAIAMPEWEGDLPDGV